MAKRASLNRLLDDLAVVRNNPDSPPSREALTLALGTASTALVEKAARLIQELKLQGYAAHLVTAFQQMLTASDPGCAARIAVVRALVDTHAGAEAAPVYQRGLRVLQREGTVDVAGPLRGYCGLGLLDIRHADALVELTDLLADPEAPARVAAARGLASVGRGDLLLLLRLRLLAGDRSPEVIGECLTALLRLEPDRSLALALRFLDDEDGGVRDAAALSLGESRHPAALAELRRAFERQPDGETRRTILVAAGLLRGHEPVDWLMSVVENGPPDDALAALQSLRVHRRDPALPAHLRDIVANRKIDLLRREVDQHWSQ